VKVGPSEILRIPDYVPASVYEGWVKQVFQERNNWKNYFTFINSFGHAWYLDIEAGMLHQYHANAMSTNASLKRLDGLVECLTKSATYLTAPDGAVGLPCRARHENLGPYWVEAGVVINTQGHEGQVHADYEGIAPYPEKLFDPQTRAYSAVLSLVKPKFGGNLKIWTKHRLGNEPPDLEDYTIDIVDYAAGTLVLFDSFCYHQILSSELTPEIPHRAVAALHFLYIDKPHPHWEYWF